MEINELRTAAQRKTRIRNGKPTKRRNKDKMSRAVGCHGAANLELLVQASNALDSPTRKGTQNIFYIENKTAAKISLPFCLFALGLFIVFMHFLKHLFHFKYII